MRQTRGMVKLISIYPQGRVFWGPNASTLIYAAITFYMSAS